MKIININDVEETEVVGNPLFTGGKVYRQPALDEDYEAQKIRMTLVRFAPGAHAKLHTHSSQQILYVTEGKGIVATKDKEYVVTPGMIIYIPSGEEHWHGATKDSSFAHFSIVGQPTEMKIVGD